MIREKIIEIVHSVSTKSIHFGMDLGSGANISEATDEIIKVFESRTCEICKLYRNKDKACFLNSQNHYTRPASIDFSGCGKWEKKDD